MPMTMEIGGEWAVGRGADPVRSRKRAGRRVLRQARQDRIRHARANWRIYLALVGSLAAATTVAAVLMTGPFVRGFWIGSMVTAIIAVVAHVNTTLSGAGSRASGGEAERFTSQELRKLDPARWFVFDHVLFADFDIDHVLVGPGAVFAVETKWRTRAPDGKQLREFTRQARRSADRLRRFLSTKSVTRTVTPLVVLWGPEHGEVVPAEGKEIDGVLVVGGAHHATWRDVLVQPTSRFEIDFASIQALTDYITANDAYHAAQKR